MPADVLSDATLDLDMVCDKDELDPLHPVLSKHYLQCWGTVWTSNWEASCFTSQAGPSYGATTPGGGWGSGNGICQKGAMYFLMSCVAFFGNTHRHCMASQMPKSLWHMSPEL
jgi:hypothetical protein